MHRQIKAIKPINHLNLTQLICVCVLTNKTHWQIPPPAQAPVERLRRRGQGLLRRPARRVVIASIQILIIMKQLIMIIMIIIILIHLIHNMTINNYYVLMMTPSEALGLLRLACPKSRSSKRRRWRRSREQAKHTKQHSISVRSCKQAQQKTISDIKRSTNT